MNAFKSGDKVTHPLTGDAVLTVLHSGVGRAGAGSGTAVLYAPASEFTPYTPPGVSTLELAARVDKAYGRMAGRAPDVARAHALIDAATAYRDRLEEEQQ